MSENPEISVIVPAYNEEKIIVNTIRSILDFFKNRRIEIIVVDDGSNDRTYQFLSSLSYPNIKIIRNYKNYGKGYSVKRGVLHSSGDYILLTDADLSTPLEDFYKLESAIKQGADLAFGSRLLEGSKVLVRQPLLRELLGKFFGFFAHLLVNWEVLDTQCGFKLFKGNAGREIFSKLDIRGYSFDIEVILIAREKGCKVMEVPVQWINHPDSKIKLFSFVYLNVGFELLKIFWNKLTGHYRRI